MHVSRLAVTALGMLLARPAMATAQQAERHAISGDHVAVYNLAGVVRVEAGSGADVVVDVTRGGRDAGKLRVETGPIRGRETLRVIYPDDRIVYGNEHEGSTSLDVGDDGTFNDDERHHTVGGRHRVRISGEGRGLEAHADVRIAVPAGKRVAVYLAVGQAFASNVSGTLRMEVSAANVTSDHTKGPLIIDTGSGDVRVTEAEGDASIDTGSGSIIATGIRGEQLKLDTGSGSVTTTRVTADVLKVDTGSGDVTASEVASPDVSIDTGSGEVRLALLSDVESLYVNTGSGDVTIDLPRDFGAHVDIETGSGEIELTGVAVKATRLERDHLVGEIGDGKGRVKIETGSGGIGLRKSGS